MYIPGAVLRKDMSIKGGGNICKNVCSLCCMQAMKDLMWKCKRAVKTQKKVEAELGKNVTKAVKDKQEFAHNTRMDRH